MNTHRKRNLTAALCLAAALLAPAAGTAVAAAAPAPHHGTAPKNCPSGHLCAYSGADYTGKAATVEAQGKDLKDLTKHAQFGHVASLYNNGASEVTVWDKKDFKGHPLTLAPHHGEKTLPHSFGHQVVSAKWHGKA
ncbi:peptidase inhibitor family I36 protein [Streptomyces gamaensis]|uniref:Peptidase inhibitor family I36 protein n=1 Tax=Streptomyces gamaensis TaxID=1763542 RepID=A0ABW0Z280_9ACTN